jgi:hypothetical protein
MESRPDLLYAVHFPVVRTGGNNVIRAPFQIGPKRQDRPMNPAPVLVAALLLAAAEPSTAAGRERKTYPVFKHETPYAAARRNLVRRGWQPVISPDADACAEGDARCQGRPEMQACAGTGEANCLFLWRRAGTVIAVSTVDDPPVVAAVECRSRCR